MTSTAEPEVHGLVALIQIQASRIPARLGPDGLPVPLAEQNRGRWDQLLIRRGFTALLRAERLGGPPGPYVLQAAIAACHARARTAADTDWGQIALLYQALAALAPSPMVELNRAVPVAMADGPERGLEIVDGLAAEPALVGYYRERSGRAADRSGAHRGLMPVHGAAGAHQADRQLARSGTKLAAFGVPRPVTGSQPVVAG